MQEQNAPSMDKLTKRYGVPATNQGNSTGIGNSSRGSVAASTPATGRSVMSQPAVSNNRSSQQRTPSRTQQIQPRQSGPVNNTRYNGNSKGGQQPQGLGSFHELGINGVEQGSRKHNYNHLINLSYGHRGDYPQRGSGQSSYGHQRYPTHSQPRFNKEQFLQANCQFIVKDDGDYAVHHVDPDLLVEWNNIEMIKVYNHEEVSCPICLHPPVAAKMTRCGHIFCWPCILHYLALSDAKWRKCPICYESVYGSELKSVVTQKAGAIKLGTEITMRLMVCERSSAWPFPLTEWNDRKGIFYNIEEDNVSLGFCKILMIRADQIQREILAREERELLFALETEGDNPESCFIEEALKDLSKRLLQSPPPSTKTKSAVYSTFLEEETRSDGRSASEEEEKKKSKNPKKIGEGSSLDQSSLATEKPGLQKDQSGSLSGSLSYFYQAADGQHVYLHPLNVRMLVAQYGQLNSSPVQITARVLEVESWSITDSVRKRYRYLSHLPLTCLINLVELEMKPPYVSEDVLRAFDEEAQQRDRQRQMKLQYEERGQRDAENAFRKDIRGRISFSLQSEFFPDFGSCLTQESLDLASEEAFPAVGAEPAVSPATSQPAPPSVPSTSRSFAQMLRQGKVQAQVATQAQAQAQAQAKTSFHIEHPSADEDYHPAPNFQSSFSNGLDAAFDRMVAAEKDSGISGPGRASGKGSKKKRTKGTLLFSTGSVPRV